MNINEFLNNIKLKFKQFDINDIEIIKSNPFNTLIIPIVDEDLPSYKLAVTFIEEGYLSIYACFKHQAVLKSEMIKLLQTVNEFNNQSFVNFYVNKSFIKISYNLPEIDDKDIDKVMRIITLIPNVIFEFYQDFKKYLN